MNGKLRKVAAAVVGIMVMGVFTLAASPSQTIEHQGSQAKASSEKAGKAKTSKPKASKSKHALGMGETVNINSASEQELAKLPHVGAKVAHRIVEYRTAHTKFQTVDELRNVKGVGNKLLENIRPHLAV